MLGDEVSSGSVGVIYEAIHRDTLQVSATKRVKINASCVSNECFLSNFSALDQLQLLVTS